METAKNVLIIDDEVDLGILLKQYLVKRKYQVYNAQTLEGGISLFKDVNPDIVFLDNNLPDGLGWERAPQMAVDNPKSIFFLISAFNPTPPIMPQDIQYYILEKPISYGLLDQMLTEEHHSNESMNAS